VAQPGGGGALPREPFLACGVAYRHRGGVWSSTLSPVRGWEPHRCHALIETVEGNMPADGTAHAPLRSPTARGMEAPILQVPSLQERRTPLEKPLRMELLTQERAPHRMRSTVNTLRQSALNTPLHAFPGWRDRA